MPSGRTKHEPVDNVRVSTGASSQGNAQQWQTLSIHVNLDDEERTCYWVSMDRETAARVAKQIVDYLAEVKS